MIISIIFALISTALLLALVIAGHLIPKSNDAFRQEQLEDWWWTCP